MEKVIYALTGAKFSDPAALVGSLEAAGARHIRINLRDAAVAPAEPLQQQRGDLLPDAVVQLWIPTANPIFRAPVDAVLGAAADSIAAWLVSEATIIPNEAYPAATGSRTYGFAQMAFLTLPDQMAWKDWRAVWRDHHTRVAIDTQSNFEYVQNLVVEPLTENAPPFVAIVEECFPPEAMTDPLVFFDAPGDPAKFQRNLDTMMESCGRFITPGTIDVFASSQYNY